MAELQTRPPTGRVAYPLVLVEGEEKAGKSYALAELSASPRVGRTFVVDIGDGTMDEYARLGPYELLVHDGTWTSIMGQVEAAAKVPPHEGRPNVIGIDSGTALWTTLKLWTDGRARRSQKGQAALRSDPDAEIDPTMNLWNDAKNRWGRLLHVLKTFDGIGVILAQGKEVTRVENGQPTRDTEWSVEVEKTTPAVASAWVRLRRPHQARLVGVRSLDVEVPAAGLVLPDKAMLDHLVFEVLGAGGADFGPSTAVPGVVGVPIAQAKTRLLGAVKAAAEGLSEDEAKAEASRIWASRGLPSGDGEIHPDVYTKLILDVAEGKIEGPVSGAQEAAPGSGAAAEPQTTVPTAEAVQEAFPGAETVEPEAAEAEGQEPDLEEVIDIPEGWVEGRCLCGEPMTFDPRNVKNAHHLNVKLDVDHFPEEPF